MRSLDLFITGRGNATQDALDPGDLVRLAQMSGTLTAYAKIGHQHLAADILDLAGPAGVIAQLVADVALDTGGFFITRTALGYLSGTLRLKPGGFLFQDPGGLYCNPSGTYSPVGHHHPLSDIPDFDVQLPAKLAPRFADTATNHWGFDGSLLTADVQLKPAGGVLADAGGLYLDFGSGTQQAARGDHGHAQLHNPLTLAASVTLTLSLAAQQLTANVKLAPLGGLVAQPDSGVACDFGPGHWQVMRGDSIPANDHLPVQVISTPSLSLSIDGSQFLSGTVVLDPAPPAGNAALALGPNGIYLPLGSGTQQAAAGGGPDGFMTGPDKTRLDTLWAASGAPVSLVHDALRVTLKGSGGGIAYGTTEYFIMPWSGTVTGWDVWAEQNSPTAMVVDVQKSTYAGFPPSVSIAGTEWPLLSGTQLNQNRNVTTWAAALAPNDVLAFRAITSGTVNRLTVQLRYTRPG